MPYTPRYSNLLDLFDEVTTRYADRPLFGSRRHSGWEWVRYGQFRRLVDQARAGLATLGVGPGDRVAVISDNRLEWAYFAYGTYTRGAVYVPMYESQLDKDWEYILRDSGAKVCLVSSDAIEKRVHDLQADLHELSHVISFDSPGCTELLRRGAEQPIAATRPDDDDLATLIYTSGTTGNPKGVCLSHRNLAANVSALLEVNPVIGGDRCLAFLPWAHVFGGTLEINTLMAVGGAIAICDDNDKLIDYLPEVRPTVLFAVPRIWNRIYDGVQKQMAERPEAIQKLFKTAMTARTKEKRGVALGLRERLSLKLADKLIFSKILERFGGELRFAVSGAAALSTDVAEFIDNLGIDVYEGYGLTESSGCTTANTPAARRLGSVGQPIPGVEVKLDTLAPGSEGGSGEIIIYGTGVMRGYHNMPEETDAVLTDDGGLRSGDLGSIDEDGFVYITGRVKEIYKLENGKYVAPAPIEEALQLSPYIAQCVLYGSDRPHNVALIVPDMKALSDWAAQKGLDTDPEAMVADGHVRELIRREIDTCSRELKGFESVRDFLLESRELSPENGLLTPTLKLKRRAIMEAYGERLAALYA
ncbi:MAG: long-chain fatty acid--CoA ligase [Myxococcales bacterium]|nr:long-chain fatty acid--CoA ligase [Myxococcales bacterium]